MYVNVEAEDGCSSVVVNGSCNCESIAACAGSRSEVSMSANETVVGIAVGAVEGIDLSRLSQAAFSSSSLS